MNMKSNLPRSLASCMLVLILSGCANEPHRIPHLEKMGTAVRLFVDDRPFLVLGGELGNSTFTSLESMRPVWPKLKAMHLNTVLAPVYWELIEPEEGMYDFELLDRLIEKAEKHHLRLILLWFGSWKNSMSSHAPAWVKLDQERFPRIRDDQGRSHEILTPFSRQNLQADQSAFRALLSHLADFDGERHTVIMVQVENEIGMLPVARDHSALANQKFTENVPGELIDYLVENRDSLVPEFREAWAENGFRETGSWEEVFGSGERTDEVFMAWFYAKYTNAIAEAGKEAYPLPMYVNAALIRPGARPGKGYPSAGPLPHLMDIWQAAGPSVDFLSPDLYFPNLKHWCDLYDRKGNPLFVPEHRFDRSVAAKAAYVIGHYEGIGFSPFSIESAADPENEPLGRMYSVLGQLTPVVAKHQGQGRVEGVLLEREHPEAVLQMGDYKLTVRHSYTLGYETGSGNEHWDPAGAVIIRTGANEFYLGGSGIVITFENLTDPQLNVGILKDEEGRFEGGAWKVVRHLNGDQTHQGRHIRIFLDHISLQRFAVYNYE